MVTRNRHDGPNSPEWWDDLPPAVRHRFSQPERPDHFGSGGAAPSHRYGLIRDLSRLAMLFVVIALANLAFLLVALSFLSGAGPLRH